MWKKRAKRLDFGNGIRIIELEGKGISPNLELGVSLIATLIELLEELKDRKLPISKVLPIVEYHFPDLNTSEITLAVAEAGFKARARSGNFVTDYYTFLAEGGKTLPEVKAFINGTGENDSTSDNVKRHLNHYLKIYALVEAAAVTLTAKLAEAKEIDNPERKEG